MKFFPQHPAHPDFASASRTNGGFTLVELLVVIAIIAVLAAIALGAIGRFADTGKQAVTAGRLRQVHVLQMAYAQDNNGLLTPFWTSAVPLTWQEKLFPYLNLVNRAGAKEDPKLVLNSPYQKITGGRAVWQEGRSFGLNNYMADASRWNYRIIRVPEPSRIILAGDMQQGNCDFLNTADGKNWYGSASGWGQPEYRHAGKKKAMMVFMDGHTELLGEEELALKPSDGSASRWNWWQ